MTSAPGLLAALLLAASLAYVSAALAQRLTSGREEDPGPSARLAAAIVVALAALTLLFVLLERLGAFRLDVALALAALAALAVRLGPDRAGAVRRRLADDLRAAREVLSALGPARWLLPLCLVPVAVRVLRGLVAPPLTWDALTYHLFRAGRWVQEGRMVSTAAPDAARYYDHFAPYGDVLWAWVMLPVRGDALLALGGLGAWLAVLLGAYASARALRASGPHAFALAFAVATPSAVSGYVTAAYVDTLTLALVLLGLAPLLRFARSAARADLVLAALALGVAAGVKQSALAFLPVAALFAAVAAGRGGGPRRAVAAGALLSLVAAAVAAPPYLRAYLDTGNPLYPLGLGSWLPGNAQLAATTGQGTVTAAKVARALFTSDRGGWDHLSYGPSGVVLVALGVAGLAVLVRARRRAEAALLVALALASFVPALSPSMGAFWNAWAAVSPRLVTPGVAALVLAAAALDRPVVRLVLWAATLWAARLALPRGLGQTDLAALRLAAPALAVLVLSLAAAAVALRASAASASAASAARAAAGSGQRRRAAPVASVAAAVAALGLLAALLLVRGPREALRYRYWEEAATWKAYELHGLHKDATRAWPVWEALDGPEPQPVAFAAGFDGTGHNWYRYPLLGSRLQNPVHYVSPAADGRTVDYAGAGLPLDPEAWVSRLAAAGIARVVLGTPPPPEAPAVRASPRFALLACGEDGSTCAWRVERPDGRADARPVIPRR